MTEIGDSSGKTNWGEMILQHLEEQRRDLKEHRKEFQEYRRDADEAHRVLGEVHNTTIAMQLYAQNLTQLPVISQQLANLYSAVDGQTTKLTESATSTQKVPTSFALVVVLFLGLALIVVLARDGQNIQVGGEHGFSISNQRPGEQAPSGSGSKGRSKENADQGRGGIGEAVPMHEWLLDDRDRALHWAGVERAAPFAPHN